MKMRFIFTLLIFCSLLTATLSPTVANAQQDKEPEENTARLGESRRDNHSSPCCFSHVNHGFLVENWDLSLASLGA